MADPDAAMMAGPDKIARFIETRRLTSLSGAFADSDVTIIENFAPHVFSGPDAVARWTGSMRGHLDGVTDLHHTFGPPRDFGRTGDLAFFSLPTRWTGVDHGKRFTEQGGWVFVLVRQGARWPVRNYAWAVVSASYD